MEFWHECPFDDQARFRLPAVLVAQAQGIDPAFALRRLERKSEPVPDVPEGNFSEADLKSMAALGLKPPKKG